MVSRDELLGMIRCKANNHDWSDFIEETETRFCDVVSLKSMKLAKKKCLRKRCDIVQTYKKVTEYWPSGCDFEQPWSLATEDDIRNFRNGRPPTIEILVVRKFGTLTDHDIYELKRVCKRSRIGGYYGIEALGITVYLEELEKFKQVIKERSLTATYSPTILQKEIYLDFSGSVRVNHKTTQDCVFQEQDEVAKKDDLDGLAWDTPGFQAP